MKKGTERITAYFGGRLNVVIVALLCGFYFLMHFGSDDEVVAKILPPFQPVYFLGLAAAVFIYQFVTWRLFKLFQPGWYKSLIAWALLLSEFISILFVFSLLSWPIYWIVEYAKYVGKLS